ncbi:type VII secretion protein EccCa [Cellulomonas pakistanensis]|uniref:Type VII secretion protein EccC n=1 Tax=Cellulomonas pakistanensis TaxID=992287 RepID=A0A919P8M0_9CELL|nr:type VII secretion protein EccCa [Cellulomonas pakistanensis]GIG36066.1 type VII secretion protein EccC [Cellulomonas pakistanensis]
MSIATQQGTRLEPPAVPSGQVVLQPPPEIQASDGVSGLLANAIPMLGSVGSIVFVAMNQPGPRGYIAAGMFLLASLGFVGVNGWRQRSQHQAQVVGARREYLAYLSDLRSSVRQAAGAQRRAAEWTSPDPRALPAVAEERTRVWERRSQHDDFLVARVGVGAQPLCLELEAPQTPPLAQLDPVAASAAHRFLVTHRVQQGVPLAFDVRSVARIEVTGAAAESRALARAVVSQLATFHAPEDLQIAVVASDAALPEWDWVKWLPHAHSTRSRDAVGAARMIGTTLADVESLLPEDLTDRPRFGYAAEAPLPHVLVVVDGGHVPVGNAILTTDGVLGVTVLELPDRWDELDEPTTLRLNVGGSVATEDTVRAPVDVLRLGNAPVRVEGDQMSVADAEATARRLLPLHVESGPERGDEEVSSELVDLLGVGDVRDLDLGVAWRPRLPRDRLRVPIGVTPQGQPVALDIKESAQQGMGPHGLIIGATGSGKSEVLRTLVLALAMTHSSEDLNFVLVDFKGGATFAGMADMPHVSAIITNLGEELTLVDRMQDALQGEMVRRQELLRAAGNFANVADYEKARKGGRTDLAPLPALLIVCDEFSELLSAKPEFVDLFVTIGRLGRSLQMHLLLSSQRLEEGRLRGLESHLSYRIGLRTFSAAESRTVLGVPDAYTLPPVPGMGYLKPDTTTMIQFRAAYVSGPPKARRRTAAGGTVAGTGLTRLESFTAAPVLGAVEVEPASTEVVASEPEESRATFDIAVQRMKDQGPPAHQVWLPPLVVPRTLDELMPDLVADPRLGLVSPGWRAAGTLTVPLGTVDRPLEQRRENLTVSLGGAAGHMAVVGAPRTGKSTVLRSVVTALALTHTPLEVQFYVLDFGGGTFAPLAALAHVAGVASRAEPDVVRRTVAEVESIVDERERYFRANGIDSIETYRTRRAQGTADDGYGDVFLLVDGWSTIRAEFDELEARIQALAGRGLTFGVHLVATAARWMDFRTQVKDLFGTRLELRLGDPMDSEIDRKVAVNVPKDRPGRGLAVSKHHVLTALPRVDADPSPDTLGAGVAHLVEAVNAAWQGPAGPKLRLLPDEVTLDRVRSDPRADARRLLLGIDEAALAPVGIDVTEEPHLYAFGDGGSGKSGLLRAVASEVRRLHTPQQAQIFAVDFRRSLLGEIPEEYLAGYFTTQDQAAAEIAGLADYLRGRLPGPDVTPEQLRSRSWWTGAEVYVIVDDYDLVATTTGNPLQPLVPLLAQAGDVGLHLVLARRSGGAGRAMYEPVLQALRDLAAPGIVMSGSPDEGALVGGAKPVPSVPGRAQLVTRDEGRQVVQLAWTPPTL